MSESAFLLLSLRSIIPAMAMKSVVVLVVVLGVYARTLHPSIPGGDSGELVAEGCHLGVAHPPGYPLFTMLVHGVTQYLPQDWGSCAWRSNMLCATCGALAAVLIQRSVDMWGFHAWGGVAAAGLFAFSPLVWNYAVGSEVFALNNLATAALTWQVLRYARDGLWSDVLLGAWLCGLALTNQHTIVLLEVPLICWVLWAERRRLSVRRVFALAGTFFLGLLPYAYLPLAAVFNAQPGSWGDPSTLSGFFHHFRRGDYGTFRLFSTDKETEGLATRLRMYADDLIVNESLGVGVCLALVGLVGTLRYGMPPKHLDASDVTHAERKAPPAAVRGGKGSTARAPEPRADTRGVGCMLLAAYVFYLVVFHSLANLPLSEALLYGVHMRFWQQPNVLFFVWVGVGFDACFAWVGKLKCARHWGTSVASAVAVALVAVQISSFYDVSDQHDNWHMHNYAKAVLAPLPPNSLLFTNYDQQWTSLRYLQRCEHYRRDVHVVQLSMMSFMWFAEKQHHFSGLKFPGTHLVGEGSDAHRAGGFAFKQVVDANYGSVSAVFLGGNLLYNDPGMKAYDTIPFGLVTQLVPRDRLPTLDAWAAACDQAWRDVQMHLGSDSLPPLAKYDERTWEWTLARDFFMQQGARATYLLEQTIQLNSSLPLLAKSAALLEHVIAEQQPFGKAFLPVHTWKNLGLAYAHMVKNTKEDFPPGVQPLSSLVKGQSDSPWRERATSRFVEAWSTFLSDNDARADPGYAQIHNVVTSLTKTRSSSGAVKESKKRKKKKKKKKKKKTTTTTTTTHEVMK